VKGFVPTPDFVVDRMVERLFRDRRPSSRSTILDPGCGEGAFVRGILRWRDRNGGPLPRIVGVESDSRRRRRAEREFGGIPEIQIRNADFLADPCDESFDFVVGNPPYVSILELSETEKQLYRTRFSTARGRFDLYLLFFERALRLLNDGGRLVFITPEKFLYVDAASPLRSLLSRFDVEEIDLVDETIFEPLLTYPTVTTVSRRQYSGRTKVIRRNGAIKYIALCGDGQSWMPLIAGESQSRPDSTLGDFCRRVSAGVATGADAVFVLRNEKIDDSLKPFAYPTIAGRELGDGNPRLAAQCSMLVPYSGDGRLIHESKLGSLGFYLRQEGIAQKLVARTCVRRKPWYAFHETPPLRDILNPKILCKDIVASPRFWIDRSGRIVPRHSVYYIVPRNPAVVDDLCEFLNSDLSTAWLRANCQRAAGDFLRLQSRILSRLPIPAEIAARLNSGTDTFQAISENKALDQASRLGASGALDLIR